ncbi:MAG: hypothetical protein Kow0042_29280 [Calditrichia bacterium]
MLILYKKSHCPECGEIEDRLNELVLAYQVEVFDSPPGTESAGDSMSLPALQDGEQIFKGKSAILKHLEELETFKQEWDKFQSDSCYCDDEGNIE